MDLKIGEVYQGFTLIHSEQLQEVNSQAYMFKHLKSGARLLYLANDDDNKVFSISFRTPASDDTGVAHILEHSVLCGSKKFPLKEPFVELVKGSLNTFLNAMTFPDKTMYPVASMNDKDFHNLMDVYLDAVFNPRIYENKYLLKQEGWHYSLPKLEDELIYKGVVYNEMKGVYSSPESVLEQASQASLFPDTTYRYESGGHPEAIPQLTQADFEKFHSLYYHPANSYIYLYGKLDIIERLKFIDQEYLQSYEEITVDSAIQLQEPFNKTKITKVEYPLSEGEDTKGRSFFSLAFVVGESHEMEKYLALNILDIILVNMPGSPLKQAILDREIAQDVESSTTSSIKQNVFSIVASGTDADKQEEFVKTIYASLQELATKGIDKKLLESALNIIEFKLRESDFGNYPKGLIYNIRVMDTWLYDQCPLEALKYEGLIEKMRENIKGRYFENFIETYLMDNTHRSLTVLTPCIGLEIERGKALKTKLEAIKAQATAAELEQLVVETAQLQAMQEYIDPPEALEKIPLLKLSDIKAEAEKSNYSVTTTNKVNYLYQPAFTNKIAYIEGHLSANELPEELISYLYLLSDLLGQLSTKKYNYFDLAQEIALHTGGISFSANVLASEENADEFVVKLSCNAKVLLNKMNKLQELISEILLDTDFTDKKRLREVINESKTSIEVGLSSQGHTIAMSRLAAYFSKAAAFSEQGSLNYYYFIRNLSENFETKAEQIINDLQTVLKYVVKAPKALWGYSCETSHQAQVLAELQVLNSKLPQTEYPEVDYKLPVPAKNEGIYTPGMVQYVAMGGDFKKKGFKYHGSMRVVETVLRYEYLWTNIRVKGGAYGAMITLKRNGVWQFVSYRDPNLLNTIEVYKQMADYLANLELSEREVLKYIIGTMSKVDMPMSNAGKLTRSITRYLLGLSDEIVQQSRTQILATKLQDLRDTAQIIASIMQDNNLCVVGSESKIKEASSLFNKIFAATSQE